MKNLLSFMTVTLLFNTVSSNVFAATVNMASHVSPTSAHALEANLNLTPEPINLVLFIAGAAILTVVALRKKLIAL